MDARLEYYLATDIDGVALVSFEGGFYNDHPQLLSGSFIDHAIKGAIIDPVHLGESKRRPYSGWVPITHRAECTVNQTKKKIFSFFEKNIELYSETREENSYKEIKKINGGEEEVITLCPKNAYLSYVIKNLMKALEPPPQSPASSSVESAPTPPRLPIPLLAVSTPDDREEHEEFTSTKALEAKALQCGEGFRTKILPAEMKFLVENKFVTEEQFKAEVGHLAVPSAEVAALRQEIQLESKLQEVKHFNANSKNNQLLQIAWFLAKLKPNNPFIMVYVDDRRDLLEDVNIINIELFPRNLVAIHCYQHQPGDGINFNFYGSIANPYHHGVNERPVSHIPSGPLPLSQGFMTALAAAEKQKKDAERGEGSRAIGFFPVHVPERKIDTDLAQYRSHENSEHPSARRSLRSQSTPV